MVMRLIFPQFEKRLRMFGLTEQKHIAATTGDGAPLMTKFGRISTFNYLLCLNHTIQLAVLDSVYILPKPAKKATPNAETNQQESEQQLNEGQPAEVLSNHSQSSLTDDEEVHSNDESESGDERGDERGDSDDEILEEPEPQVFMPATYSETIQRMRKVVKIFKFSPLANATLQKIIERGGGKTRRLPLDVRTRWSSLATCGQIFLENMEFIVLALAHKSIKKSELWSDNDTAILKVFFVCFYLS